MAEVKLVYTYEIITMNFDIFLTNLLNIEYARNIFVFLRCN